MSPSIIFRSAAAAGLGFAAVSAGAGCASAHVEVSAPGAVAGGDAVLTFRVPNESGTDSPSIGLTVRFPGLDAVDTQPKPGWKSTVGRDGGGHIVSVTWTADPGGGIPVGQFDQFQVLADNLPDQQSVSFPATQTYADGETVEWNQHPNADGSDPERPAPTLELAPAHGGHVQDGVAQSQIGTDSTARWLGGIGVGLGIFAVGGVAAMVVRGRS